MESLFPLGMCVVTAHAQNTLPSEEIQRAMERHARGDWGDLCQEDWKENEVGLTQGGRLFSRYLHGNDTPFYVITECDRSVTTVLMADDY